MDALDALKLGVRMRAAQNAYFDTRTDAAFKAARALEKQFDRAARDVLQQPPLFRELAEDLADKLRAESLEGPD